MVHPSNLQSEDEGVTSGFSPRALSLPIHGAWPSDQLPSTPHKRTGQYLPHYSGPCLPEICIQVTSTAHEVPLPPPPPSLQHNRRAILVSNSVNASSSLPSPLGPGSVYNKPIAPLVLSSSSVENSTPKKAMALKMHRAPSIPRSPTIPKGISSLAEMDSEEQGRHGLQYRQLDMQPLLPAILVGLALLGWCLRAVPSLSLAAWILPDDVAARGCLEFLSLCLLLSLAAVALNPSPNRGSRGRHLAPQDWSSWRVSLRLGLGLGQRLRRGLGQGLRRGARYYLKLDQSEEGRRTGGGVGSGQSYGGESSGGSISGPSSSGNISHGSHSSPKPPPVASLGVHVYSNGDRYEGEFYDNKCSGSGVYHFAVSGCYEGDWVDGKYDGHGVETWSRGSRYRGQYRKGLRDGYGVYRFYTGDVYSGSWSSGQSHGSGIQTCIDGSKYVGSFSWGAKHGYGKYTFRNGDMYCGEYFSDKMHGYGIYHFGNQHRYEGAWHEGRKQGLGVYSFRNGESREGYWHRGALETRSTHCATSGTPTAVSHSRVLHAVQEARRAATKAENVMLVEDRVVKAVAAANKSAVAARLAAVKANQQGSSPQMVDI